MCILLIFFQIKLSYLLHSTTIYPFYNPAKSALLQKTKKRSPASLTRDRKASAVPPELTLCPNACTLFALLPITQEKRRTSIARGSEAGSIIRAQNPFTRWIPLWDCSLCTILFIAVNISHLALFYLKWTDVSRGSFILRS